MVHTRSAREEYSRRMLRKAIQQGRREFGDRSVSLRYVAGRRATENPAGGLFQPSCSGFLPEEERSIQPGDGDGDEFDRQQQSAHDGIGRRRVQDEVQAEEFGSL
jgi:hypothetical protein